MKNQLGIFESIILKDSLKRVQEIKTKKPRFKSYRINRELYFDTQDATRAPRYLRIHYNDSILQYSVEEYETETGQPTRTLKNNLDTLEGAKEIYLNLRKDYI